MRVFPQMRSYSVSRSQQLSSIVIIVEAFATLLTVFHAFVLSDSAMLAWFFNAALLNRGTRRHVLSGGAVHRGWSASAASIGTREVVEIDVGTAHSSRSIDAVAHHCGAIIASLRIAANWLCSRLRTRGSSGRWVAWVSRHGLSSFSCDTNRNQFVGINWLPVNLGGERIHLLVQGQLNAWFTEKAEFESLTCHIGVELLQGRVINMEINEAILKRFGLRFAEKCNKEWTRLCAFFHIEYLNNRFLLLLRGFTGCLSCCSGSHWIFSILWVWSLVCLWTHFAVLGICNELVALSPIQFARKREVKQTSRVTRHVFAVNLD